MAGAAPAANKGIAFGKSMASENETVLQEAVKHSRFRTLHGVANAMTVGFFVVVTIMFLFRGGDMVLDTRYAGDETAFDVSAHPSTHDASTGFHPYLEHISVVRVNETTLRTMASQNLSKIIASPVCQRPQTYFEYASDTGGAGHDFIIVIFCIVLAGNLTIILYLANHLWTLVFNEILFPKVVRLKDRFFRLHVLAFLTALAHVVALVCVFAGLMVEDSHMFDWCVLVWFVTGPFAEVGYSLWYSATHAHSLKQLLFETVEDIGQPMSFTNVASPFDLVPQPDKPTPQETSLGFLQKALDGPGT
jgi:hypothetical protein